MYNEPEKSITSEIIKLQDKNGCWNVLKENDKYFKIANYYAPNFKSALWTLVLLADIQTDVTVKFPAYNLPL